jgi:DNA-binding transcriptional LysR family regulator
MEGLVTDLDFKALRFFSELYRFGSVSLAAERVHLSQPTGSALLAKLRKSFDDPLFVKTATGMVATARAQQMARSLNEALRLLERELSTSPSFDQAASRRDFRICMTDISQLTLLPRLRGELQKQAPEISITILELDERTPALLADGTAELAIGFVTHIGQGFLQQRLIEQKYLCLARADHPRLRRKLTQERYLAEQHIQVAAPGTGHRALDEDLRRRKIRRRIALTLPSFLGVGHIVARSDLLATVPAAMAREVATAHLCRSYPLPFATADFSVKQYWHARHHDDPGHRWLRTLIARLFHAAPGSDQIG